MTNDNHMNRAVLAAARIGSRTPAEREAPRFFGTKIPSDESARVSNIYILVQALFQDAVQSGYDRSEIAEAFLHGACDVLADDTKFLAVLARFKALRELNQIRGD
jgi:hypothetical protein